MKTAGGIILGIAGAVALVAAVWAIAFAAGWLTAGPTGKLQARQAILSGQSRIQAYDHFFNLCASVQADEDAIDAQLEELDGSTGDDRDRIRANLAGLRSTRATAIREYNVDARKSYTIGQFRDLGLPFEIDPTPYVQGGKRTSCVS